MSISTTPGSPGNALPSQSLGAAAAVSFLVDFTTDLGGFVQTTSTPGSTVSVPSGLRVQAFSTAESGGSPTYDTISFAGADFTIASVASTTNIQSFFLPTGKYKVLLTNIDATNAITVQATTATIS